MGKDDGRPRCHRGQIHQNFEWPGWAGNVT